MVLTKEEITKILLEELEHLTSEYGVKRIGLFGSYAKGTNIKWRTLPGNQLGRWRNVITCFVRGMRRECSIILSFRRSVLLPFVRFSFG